MQGSVQTPPPTADISSYWLQSKAPWATIIGLANAGSDLQNCIKQSASLAITTGGWCSTVLLAIVNGLASLCTSVCNGPGLTKSLY